VWLAKKPNLLIILARALKAMDINLVASLVSNNITTIGT